ncbi:HNH endonuclease [Modestobacter sp. VKM Ac-2978]|uniref:HNH endonuclease n=1 Tax=Modestobacter sp. VKM Ac-2978 TaxID=3004132 RepID=UPI0022AA23CA|nr:hypothetical protein [Modestobacter sp. VKM Ac-2978]MCZ2849132.1 hypothetical protein [Modestobacter sp. VKM Ac-2978]
MEQATASVADVALTDPYVDFERALERLDALRHSVATAREADAVFETLADLQLAVVRSYGGRKPKAPSGVGAQTRILQHLQARCGEWVSGEELAAVSRIGEWARRVRELRVERGYDIQEESGLYCLVSVEPSEEAAQRWRLLNEMRRTDGSPRDRVLALLTHYEGGVVSQVELDYVSRGRDSGLRVRELRDDEGFPIESSADAPDLATGEFRLVSSAQEDRHDPRQRLFDERVRQQVFQRDNFTCWRCRRNKQIAGREGDARFHLELHHLEAGGESLDRLPVEQLNDRAQLATYCRACHRQAANDSHRQRRVARADDQGWLPGSTGTA